MEILILFICLYNPHQSTNSLQFISKFQSKIEKFILKFMWNLRRPKIANTILKKNKKTGGLTLFYFKNYYYKATVTKIVWY